MSIIFFHFSRVNLSVIQFHSGETSRPRDLVNVTWFLRGQTNEKAANARNRGQVCLL